MDNEISIQGVASEDRRATEGINQARMRGKENQNRARKRQKRPCTFIGFMSADDRPEQDDAISERKVIKDPAGRISRAEAKILGVAFVGTGIFLQNGRRRDRRGHQEVRRRAGERQK